MKQFSLGQEVRFKIDGDIVGTILDADVSNIIKEETIIDNERCTVYKQEIESLVVQIRISPKIAEPVDGRRSSRQR